ncbi:IclR family transcriptional regulator [Gordonia sp. PKS22-38]|uniref:IclR family transcriptional regulator n=1 Tax=Gordonia prachuapensis TaxID=3115651 RepID=A0ABU7MTL1_9ACTN|nr:IclR family transcriptional regulator [Gordonia sp. PKS22-38]
MPTRSETMIDRVVDVLEAFKTAGAPLTASAVSRRTGIPMPSAHRIVNDLVRTGLLERNDALTLRIGMRLWEIAARSTPVLTLREIALPFMEDLLAVVKAPTLLSVLDRNDVVNVETLSPHNPQATNVTQPGVRLPALVSSPGIILVAFAPPDVRDDILETARITRFTAHTVVDRTELRRFVEDARRVGHATIPRWIYPDATGIAVPVLGADGDALAALSVTKPFDVGVPSDLLPAMHTTARGIARAVVGGASASPTNSPEIALLKQQLRRATEVR